MTVPSIHVRMIHPLCGRWWFRTAPPDVPRADIFVVRRISALTNLRRDETRHDARHLHALHAPFALSRSPDEVQENPTGCGTRPARRGASIGDVRVSDDGSRPANRRNVSQRRTLVRDERLTSGFHWRRERWDVQKSVHETVDQGVRQFFSRYDVLSPGVGVMCVTSYCVAKGQDPWTAIGISFAATVLALVLSEAMDEITCSKK